MTTLMTATLPRAEFALAETLSSVREATFEVEEIVETGDDSVMPLVWAGAADQDRLDDALRADPTTEHVELLSSHGERWLYRMEWADNVQLLLQMLVANEATALEASTSGERWVLRIMFPTHDEVSATREFCQEHNITLGVHSIREMDTEPAGRYGLTEEQYEALRVACESGYYAVPREIALDDLAEDFDISHQAFSERLRRAVDALVRDTLLIEEDPPETDR